MSLSFSLLFVRELKFQFVAKFNLRFVFAPIIELALFFLEIIISTKNVPIYKLKDWCSQTVWHWLDEPRMIKLGHFHEVDKLKF